jgi:hypothetical protein
MNQVARNADACVGAEIGVGLYLDESAFQKKGDKSVGAVWRGSGMDASENQKIARSTSSAPLDR